jgi:sugar phosphate isomerase/epimerase
MMYINLCPETVGIDGLSLQERIDLAVRHGFEGVDLPADELSSMDDAERAAEAIAAAGLRWGLFWLPADFLAERAEYEEGMELLAELAPRVACAGCTRTYAHIWPGSHDMPYSENMGWHVRRLRPLAATLSEHGISLGLEFIGPKTLRAPFRYPFVHTLAQAAELADTVHPATGIVVDCFHWYTSGGTLQDLRRHLRAEQVVNVHANDARAGRQRDEQIDMEREMPLATGIIDAPGVLRVLDEMGYDGPLIAEPFQPALGRLRQLAPDDAAAEVIAVMRALVARSRAGDQAVREER